MDRLEAMSVLVAAVETGSLSAAGRKLGIPLPTVSRKLSELEAHLRTRLLNRTTRRLMLTDAGSAYLEASRRILDEVGNAERLAAGEYSEPRGHLAVTAPIVFGRLHVLPVITEFLARFPQIDVRLRLSDRNAHLIEEQIDVAVRIGRLSDSSLVATRVGEVRYVVGASLGYLEKQGTPKTPKDLSALDCITFDDAATATVWSFATRAAGKAVRSVPIRSRLSVNTAEAAIDAAVAGIGITRVLSYQAAEAVARGKLKIVLGAFEREPLPVNLVHAGQGLLALKTRSFLEFAALRLRGRLAALPKALQSRPMNRPVRHGE
jgi:DNA-binding transcriptional LysR family regulator